MYATRARCCSRCAQVAFIESYLRANHLWRSYSDHAADAKIKYSAVLHLDLSTVHGALAGPKRPHDRVALTHMKKDWESCLSAKVGFKGYGIAKDKLSATAAFDYEGKQYKLHHGSVVIAAVRSQLSCVLLSVPRVVSASDLARADHVVHEHVEPVGDDRRRPAGEERRGQGPHRGALHQDLALPRLRRRHPLPEGPHHL